jgi:hypothetical protein
MLHTDIYLEKIFKEVFVHSYFLKIFTVLAKFLNTNNKMDLTL